MLTREQRAAHRVETYLSMALQVLAADRLHRADHRLEPHAWSASYLCLSKLLGSALTKQMGLAGTPCRRFRYLASYGEGAGSLARPGVDGDHVVPMRALVQNLTTRPPDSVRVADLRRFLQQHVVMAEVPQNMHDALNKKLRHTMPAHAEGWDGEIAGITSWRRLWSRYEAIGVEPPPFSGSSRLWEES